jgi:thiol-disulfide isomerase/thioredoxin
MIRSKNFWAGSILLALIPVLVWDISWHYFSWQKEVWEQIIYATQNVYNYTREQKAEILDKAFESNKLLGWLMAVKSVLCLLFLFVGVYQLRLYAKKEKPSAFKPMLTGLGTVILFLAVKFFWTVEINNTPGAQFLTVKSGNTSFQNIVNDNFKGKVVYADFWGTTCVSCLAEFANFTHPLKDKYKSNHDIAYLYISRGNRYTWKQQIEKYQVNGYHLFLDDKDYDNLYRNALNNDTAAVFMPHYLIVNKNGKVAVKDAKSPSDQDKLFAQLNQYLAEK